MSKPEASMRVFLIGTGAAGVPLGLWLSRRGHRLVGVWNRSPAGARSAEEALGVSVQSGEWPELPECELVLLAVSDRAVAEVGEAMRARLRDGMVLAHTSGALPAATLGAQPVPRGSLHPLIAMRRPKRAADALNRALFTVEGDPEAVTRLEDLVATAGGRVQRLQPAAKPLYHAAAVMAANLAVALVAEAGVLAAQAGILDAERALAELAGAAIENVIRQGSAEGLTGPVSRGDAEVVRAHLAVLEEPAQTVYRALSLRAVELAEQRGLDSTLLEGLRSALRS